MNKSLLLCTALLLSPGLRATEAAMNQSLAVWQQRMAEYAAAVDQAATPEAKTAVALPDGRDVAPALWQSIAGKTGTRTEEYKVKKETRKRTVDTYEFEQAWAAPAVVWMLNHPEAFASVFRGKSKSVSFFSNALLTSLENVHYSSPAAADICAALAGSPGAREYAILQKIYLRNTDKEARACAALAMSLMLNSQLLAGVEGSEALARSKRVYYLKQALLLSQEDTMFGTAPLSSIVEQQTYYLRYLAPGSIPPQVKLKDADGKEAVFPQPGKVTLFFFWSPDEDSGAEIMNNRDKLEQQYPGLELVPVMPFSTPEVVQQLSESGISTYMDNEKGAAGQAYRIASVPSVLLVGKTSTVLYNGIPDIGLQTALDTALQKEKAAATSARPKVTIKAEEPVIQPGSVAKPSPKKADAIPQETDTPPALREMPEF